MGGVTLKGELQFAFLGRDEAAGPRKVNRDDGGVLTCMGRHRVMRLSTHTHTQRGDGGNDVSHTDPGSGSVLGASW